jgi:signal transduction histidine kinase
MAGTPGRVSASARRAAALVVGRWVGVGVVSTLILVQLVHAPSALLLAALASAVPVLGANLAQRRALAAGRMGAVHRFSRVLLALDGLFVLLTVLGMSRQPVGGYFMLGWLPIEGAIAGGGATAVAGGAFAVAAVLAESAMRRQGLPVPSPYDGSLVRILNLVAITGVMVAVERALGRGERAMAQHAADLAAAVEREREARLELQAFSTIVLAGVADKGSLDEVLRSMTKAVARTMDYEAMAVLLLDQPGLLHCRSWFGDWPGRGSPIFVVGPGSIVGRVAQQGRPILLGDPAGHPDYFPAAPGPRSEICVPLRIGERILGVVNVESSTPHRYGQDDLDRLQRLADQLAVVIERARLADREAATVARLHELDRLKDDFVAMTSHELRTPLTVIRGFARTLLRADLELDAGERRRYTEVIDRQTARLSRLVEDLLAASRMEAGRLDVVMGEHEPAKLLAEYAEEWSTQPSRVELDLADDLPVVVTDPDRLAQVVRNLVDNGLRYGEGSPVRVVARRDGSDLVVEVSDQGPGIPRSELAHVFERFRQVGASPDHRAGMGLGLWITRKLATAIGSSIRVTSVPGQGTTFSVRVPGRQPEPALSRARPRQRPTQPPAARPPASRAG